MEEQQNGELEVNERVIADKVANEILDNNNKHDKNYLIFILLFIVCLTFIVSSVSFAVFSSYQTGSTDNVITPGSVLFSFNEGSNNIEIFNAFPTSDDIGKSMSGNKEYLDFTISVGFSEEANDETLKYEVSLLPVEDNTLDEKYIRVYLVEDGKEVLINNNAINNFSSLTDSTLVENAKILAQRTIDDDSVQTYRLKLWLSDKYDFYDIARTFKCKIYVKTYQ